MGSMEDDRLDDLIRHTLAEAQHPPEPPLDEMWARIERRVFDDARATPMLHYDGSRLAGSPWTVPSLVAAAALILGVGLGWYIAPRHSLTPVALPRIATTTSESAASTQLLDGSATGNVTPASRTQQQVASAAAITKISDARTNSTRHIDPTVQAAGNAPLGITGGAGALRLISQLDDKGGGSGTAGYLTRTAMLLASLPPAHAVTGSDTAMATRASELLTQTHLLLDSPAGRDPTLHKLLEDLELVLAQIARLHGPGNGTDLQLIHQTLAAHDVLPRVYDATVEASITD